MEMGELKEIANQKIVTEESEKEQKDECEEESLLKEAQSAIDTDKDQRKHSLSSSVDLVKKLVMITILWIAHFLTSVAFSTIAPFFPEVVSRFSYAKPWPSPT